jgi:hypothetical protein
MLPTLAKKRKLLAKTGIVDAAEIRRMAITGGAIRGPEAYPTLEK